MSAVVIPFPTRPPKPSPEQLYARGLAALATLQHGSTAERERTARAVGETLAELARLAREHSKNEHL